MKKYKKLTEEQLKSTYVDWYGMNAGKEELAQLARDNTPEAKELAALLSYKQLFIELPPAEIIALCLILAGLGEKPSQWVDSGDPQQSVQDFFATDEFDTAFDALDSSAQGWVLSCTFAIASNMQAVQSCAKSMYELLAEFESGDDEALFTAISIDRTALCVPSAQSRIQLAELVGDEAFFDKLSKAVKKSRPARPNEGLDDMRAMLYVLEDVGALADASNSDLVKCFVDELQIYDDDRKSDPSAAIAKFVQRFKKARTPKA